MKSFLRTLVKTRRMVFWQNCRKWNAKTPKVSARRNKFKEGGTFWKRCLPHKSATESYKLRTTNGVEFFCRMSETFFCFLLFGKTLLPHNVFLDTVIANLSNLPKVPSKVLRVSRSKVKFTKHKKPSFGKVPFAINSLKKWNNFLLTLPEVIHWKL